MSLSALYRLAAKFPASVNGNIAIQNVSFSLLFLHLYGISV